MNMALRRGTKHLQHQLGDEIPLLGEPCVRSVAVVLSGESFPRGSGNKITEANVSFTEGRVVDAARMAKTVVSVFGLFGPARSPPARALPASRSAYHPSRKRR
jgi:hypothetical protein